MVVQIKSGKRGNGKSFSFNLYRKRSSNPSHRFLDSDKALSFEDLQTVFCLSVSGRNPVEIDLRTDPVVDLRTTTSQKCEAAPRRACIQGP